MTEADLSFIIIDPDGTAGPRGRATTDESGVDAREQLPGSHDRRVRAVENAIVAPVLCQNSTDWNSKLHREVVIAMNSDTAGEQRDRDNL